MVVMAGYECKRCKATHFSFCPRLIGRFQFYRQFIGEAPLGWVVKQIIRAPK